MKRNSFLYAIAGIAVWGLASCSSSDNMHPEQTDGRVPVELTNNIIGAVTRAATTLNESALTTGDITVRTSEAYATAYTYTAGAEGAMTSTAPAYYPAGGASIDIVAYSPANANDGTSETFTVSADQSSDDAYIASDLLWAKAENKNSASGAVNIAFAHKMAKIIVNVTAGNGISTIQSITLKNIKRQCTFDYASGAVSDVAEVSGATDVAVTTGGTTASSMGAACIPAQDLIGDFIEITTDKGTATYRLSSAKPVSAGNYYTINLTLNLAAVGTINTIEAWSDCGSVNILPTGGGWTVSVSGTYTYTGSAIVPAAADITVKDVSDNVVSSSDYGVYCDNNINAGEARIIVYGINSHAGSAATGTYTIGKKAGTIAYATTNISKRYGDAAFINTLTKNGDGTVAYTSSNESVATVDSDGKVKITQGATSGSTATVTATVTPTDNFTFEDPSVNYTLTVSSAAYTISQLKIDADNGLGSEHLGYEVWSNGDLIHKDSGVTPTDANATKVGYVAYLSTNDVDTGVSGSRILVLSAVDVGDKTSWGPASRCSSHTLSDSWSLCGYSNTSTMVNCTSDHLAAQAAWNYSTTIPTGGATPAHWFLPSYKQYVVMIAAFDPNVVNNNNDKSFPNFKKNMDWEQDSYWTSTEANSVSKNAYALYASGSWDNDYEAPIFIAGNLKSSSLRVRACFAY
ncbi:MAG: fimbrillin family protein [Prevotella sp.]|nr:fimbrillin family protein [Prevotella sp.]